MVQWNRQRLYANHSKRISRFSDLVEGGNNFSGKTINIANNLDLGAHLWKPIGKNSTLTFSGTVDGNNHELSNLYVTNLTTSFSGLFGQITLATVKNIKLVNPTITAKADAGCIAGGLLNFSTVLNCHATGVNISGTEANIGGLVGSLLGDSVISKSSSNGQVSGVQQIGGIVGSPYNLATISECYSAGTVTGKIHVGGIAGYSAFAFQPNRTITVNNCYSRANLVCTNGNVGGIFGGSSALLVVKNSYATGLITSTGPIGGVLGEMGGVTATNNYWDTQSSGTTIAVATWSGAPGSVVKTQTLNTSVNKIDMSGMVSGIYFLSVQTENGTSTHKIIKK